MNPYLLRAGCKRPTVVGHRGACGLAPENTLDSFALAFDLGASVVELDVHLTRDKKLVVIHDDTLDRTTDARARWAARSCFVSDATLDELRELDAGHWFVDAFERKPLPPPHGPTEEELRRWLDAHALERYASGKVHVPTLEEVLELVRRRDGFANVELKSIPRFQEGVADAAVALVKQLQLEERVAFSSFDHRAVHRVKTLAPEIAAGALTVERLHEPARYVKELLGADTWLPSCVGEIDVIGFHSIAFEERGADGLDRSLVQSAHERGVSIFVWTENDPKRQKALVALGVDGIITDYPNRLSPESARA
jgi:glycerophosphoryl diester phosphodiesterase